MSWLKENWFKIIVALSVVTFTLVLCGTLINITELLVSYRLSQYDDKLRQELKDKQIIINDLFDKKIKCQDEVDKFKKKYNNVTGGSYNEFSNSCDIEFEIEGKKQVSNMELMSDN
jgi:hypothetical protein